MKSIQEMTLMQPPVWFFFKQITSMLLQTAMSVRLLGHSPSQTINFCQYLVNDIGPTLKNSLFGWNIFTMQF